jgi:hypothetical protein
VCVCVCVFFKLKFHLAKGFIDLSKLVLLKYDMQYITRMEIKYFQ